MAMDDVGPTRSERIAVLDVLRGFALLGILVMNVQSYGLPSAAYLNPTAYGHFLGADYVAWLVGYYLCDLKFVSLFSMLFGAGILLSTKSFGPGPARPAAFHRRRMAVLLGFGVLHAYLVWYGDILFAYGVCGLLVYQVRRFPTSWKLKAGLALAVVPSLLGVIAFGLNRLAPGLGIGATLNESLGVTGVLVPRELAAFQGPWAQSFVENARLAVLQEFAEFPLLFLWRASGFMLVGMALLEQGVLSGTAPGKTYRLLAERGFIFGLPAVAFAAWLHEETGWRPETSYFLIGQLNALGSIGVALGWVGLWGGVVTQGWLGAVTVPMGALGRVAFSAYLTQSLISTFVFRGYGLGLFGTWSRAELLAYAVALWLVQVLVANWWVRRFDFGPFEWAWRSLTYGRWFSLRRA